MRTIIRNNYGPHTGDYHERIIQDEAREKTWLFDCDGVYLDITAGRGDVKVVNELGDSEVFATSQKLVTDELGKKQETLVAGDNITIEGNVISAGGGNYTAGYGLTLTGTEFAANTSVLATQTDLAGKQDTLTTGQLAAVNSGIDSTKVGQIATNTGSITAINGKIPAQATSTNQLADKDFVNSSIATNTANFIGTFNSVAELEAYSGPVTNNDYAFVIVTDAQGNTAYDRYKYNGSTSTWLFEYELNNSSFTAEQWASINSGITSGDVTKLSGIAAGAEVNVQSNWDESDTSSDAYILNKPTIPTVNDATLTITQNGTSVGTFTANASTDATIALTDTTYSAFTGTDGTSAGTAGLVPAPATTDAGKVLSASGSWMTPDAGIKTLTTADYNYPTVNPTSVALWLLPTGCYKLEPNVAYSRNSSQTDTQQNRNILVFVQEYDSSTKSIFLYNDEIPRIYRTDPTDGSAKTSAYNASGEYVLIGQSVKNDLTSTSTSNPLSAAQGKVLKDLIDSLVIKNAGAPTTSTTGTKGQLLEDTTNGNLYICTNSASPYAWKQIDKDEILTNAGAPTTSTAGTLGQLLTDTTNAKLYQLTAIDTTDPQNPSYTWTEVGGSSVNVVQTTGKSTTDVMSQNATTGLVKRLASNNAYGNYETVIGAGNVTMPNSGNYFVLIGGINSNVSSANNSVIIRGDQNSNNQTYRSSQTLINPYGGSSTGYYGCTIGGRADGDGSVAIGYASKATSKGEVNIGIGDSYYETSCGYNSSAYRLLTGLYDGQSAHDAATVAQGNTLSTTAPTTTTEGVLGQLYTDTTNMHTYQCTAIDTTDPDNPVYTWTQRW